MRAAIEVKISSDMPLPTPRSVTSSPNHMIMAVPAVMTSTMTARSKTPAFGRIGNWEGSQFWNSCPRSASATMPVDCRMASATVR